MTSSPDAAERWRAFAVCMGAGFMTLLDVSIVNVALPPIEAGLDAGPSELQWIVAGYTLAFGLALVPAGRLGDIVGRRRMFVVGLSGFVLASAACGLAASAEMLAATRLVQGFAAGLLNPQVIGLIQQLFHGAERGRAFGLYGAVIGVSTAVGPLAGGVLIAIFGEAEGWRAVFLVNFPIGAVLIPLALRHLPAARAEDLARQGRRLDLDIGGLALLAVATVALMLPFVTEGPRRPWWLLGVAALAIVAFAWWERRTERAGRATVVTAALVRTRSFTFGTALGTAYFGGFTGIFLITTLYLQNGLGLTPLHAGLALTPNALLGALSAARSGALLQRFGRWTVVAGIVVMVLGIVGVDVVVNTLDGTAAVLGVAACMTLAGAGNGVVISPNQTLTLAEVDVRRGSTAGAVLQTSQRIGASVGIAAISAVFFAALATSGGGPARGYGPAMSLALRVTVVLLLVSLAIGVADALRRRRDDVPA